MSSEERSREEMERWPASQPEPNLTDPDNPAWTEADFARALGPEHLPPEVLAAFPNTAKRLGRPPAAPEVKKAEVKLRLDPDVLAAWRASGPGWQTRMNEALRKAMPAGA